jgi:hypothetical protein
VDVALGHPGEALLTIDVIAATCHEDVCTIRRAMREQRLLIT